MARIDSGKTLLRTASKLVAGTMVATMALTGAAGMIATQAAEAAAYQQPENGKTIAGHMFWEASAFSSIYGSTYAISATYKGKSQTVFDARHSYVTNGKTMYYVKAGRRTQTLSTGGTVHRGSVYRCNATTGKSKKVASGKFDGVKGALGKYVYAVVNNEPEYTKLYAINAKTGKKRLMVKTCIATVQYKGKHVLTTPNYGSLDNYPVYLFKANGSGKKKVAVGCGGKLTKKYVYYVKYSYSKSKYRAYRYSIKSGKKKAVTGWTKSNEAVAKYWVEPSYAY